MAPIMNAICLEHILGIHVYRIGKICTGLVLYQDIAKLNE